MIFSKFKWKGNSLLELSDARAAFIYFRSVRFNLLTGFPETYPFDHFLKRLGELKMSEDVSSPTVFHFYYEMGLLLSGFGHHVSEDTPLVIELVYNKKKIAKLPRPKLSFLPLKSIERPNWSEYKASFACIQEHLLNGNCYQVNLTCPYEFMTDEVLDPRDISDFFFSRKGLSAYAHITHIPDEMIVSNSPECLFQYRNNKVFTIPIKGTIKRGKSFKEDWSKLTQDVKEESELIMIADLLRNDLNRLEKPQAKVIKERAPLLVTGLLHQCAILSVEISNELTILKTVEALFPGGSVTGAPKKRVMEIISEVEPSPRGIYCGATLLCLGKDKVASINIRTAKVNLGERIWRYGAGGGITLLSKGHQEFQEMEEKVASFLTLLGAPGYTTKAE